MDIDGMPKHRTTLPIWDKQDIVQADCRCESC